MNKFLFSITVLVSILIIPSKTFAWGKKGHALIAEVAFNYLDENTKKIVLQYLDGTTIEDAANWMDNIKKDHSLDYMKPYHYANFEKGENVEEIDGSNIIFQLNQTIKNLQNKENLSKDQIKIQIQILFHLIGDLHQPLHIGYGSDKGGNKVQIYYNYKGTNLHSLWDSGIIESKNITLGNCIFSNKFSKPELDKIREINVVNWGNDSRNLLDKIYKINANNPSDEYIDSSVILIQSQIYKAGVRLSAVLKQTFGNS